MLLISFHHNHPLLLPRKDNLLLKQVYTAMSITKVQMIFPFHYQSVSEEPVVSRVSVLAGDRDRLLQLVDTCKHLQAQQLLLSLSATTVRSPLTSESWY